jgi:hemoglobin
MHEGTRLCADKRGESLYQQMGGESVVRRLVETFYDIVEREPVGEPLRRLHLRGNGIARARREQFYFLSGFFGGHKLYVERHGHSNVRKLHAHVDVDPAARDAWIECIRLATDRIGLEAGLRARTMLHVTRVSGTRVNGSPHDEDAPAS